MSCLFWGLNLMTDDELKRIDELGIGITEAPWRALGNSQGLTGVHGSDCVIYHAKLTEPDTAKRQIADATFIAASRELLPKLVAECRELRANVEHWCAVSEKLHDEQNCKFTIIGAALLDLIRNTAGEFAHKPENDEQLYLRYQLLIERAQAKLVKEEDDTKSAD